jgi:hypothetical protein
MALMAGGTEPQRRRAPGQRQPHRLARQRLGLAFGRTLADLTALSGCARRSRSRDPRNASINLF